MSGFCAVILVPQERGLVGDGGFLAVHAEAVNRLLLRRREGQRLRRPRALNHPPCLRRIRRFQQHLHADFPQRNRHRFLLTSLGEGPWQGDMSAVIAQCSEHTYLKSGKRIDGSMFSCTSLGVKLGGGIGVALSGWLLDISGYINLDNAVQPDSCINMMYFMYLWLPFIFDIIITVILSFLNVESANMKLKENMQNQ